MKKTIFVTLFTALTMILVASSCTGHGRSAASDGDGLSSAAAIEELEVGEPYRICEQVLTSEEALNSLADTTRGSYDRETTPLEEAFFYPDEDLKDFGMTTLCGRLFNVGTVFDHVVQSLELFLRKSSALEMDDSCIVLIKADTLALIREDIIPIPEQLLVAVLPMDADREAARKLLAAYDGFDGNSEEGSPISFSLVDFIDHYRSLPMPVEEEVEEGFYDRFWDWYDKRQFVSRIDEIQTLWLRDLTPLPDETLEHLRKAVEGERDIDRRTILALEYAKWDEYHGALLLGEILESGLYTRYLLEAFVTWRASVQMAFLGPSSFCVIPNNYYSRIQVRCLNTILRHLKESPDDFGTHLLADLLTCGMLHRHGSIAGNESLHILTELQFGRFVHPRVLEEVE